MVEWASCPWLLRRNLEQESCLLLLLKFYPTPDSRLPIPDSQLPIPLDSPPLPNAILTTRNN
ncbi:MAG: hypothetical protein F6K55_01560 [Moorea sp. SIO4A3]|nr:hypothetical protein [Moorena sp. SIO4A3]